MGKFENLAQKNVDHYNEHTVSHMVFAMGWLVVTAAVGYSLLGWMARKDQEEFQMKHGVHLD